MPSWHAQVQFYLHLELLCMVLVKKIKLEIPCFFDEVDISAIFYLKHVW
jgi:hypothetical protein